MSTQTSWKKLTASMVGGIMILIQVITCSLAPTAAAHQLSPLILGIIGTALIVVVFTLTQGKIDLAKLEPVAGSPLAGVEGELETFIEAKLDSYLAGWLVKLPHAQLPPVTVQATQSPSGAPAVEATFGDPPQAS